MILTHLGVAPTIHPDAYVAPTATVCGDVTIGGGARIMFGACVAAEGAPIEIGRNTIAMENAVVRFSDNRELIGRAESWLKAHPEPAGR
jgi:carbonic anhydrase/acetyltransferase-like protein (isoleucine patch superfamily)